MKKKVGEILIQAGIITEEMLSRALKEQDLWGEKIGRILIQLGFINEEVLFNVLSEQFGLPLLTIAEIRIDDSAILKLPIQFITNKRIFPYSIEKEVLNVLSDYIIDDATLKKGEQLSGLKIKMNLISESELTKLFHIHVNTKMENATAEDSGSDFNIIKVGMEEDFLRDGKYFKQLSFITEKINLLNKMINNYNRDNPLYIKTEKRLNNLISLLLEKKMVVKNPLQNTSKITAQNIKSNTKSIDTSILSNITKLCRLMLRERLVSELEFFNITGNDE